MTEPSLFDDLSSEVRAEILQHATAVSVRAGEWLFRAGERADAMYVVESGRIEILEKDSGALLRVLGPGSALGEIGLLTGLPRTASARARRDTRAWRVDADGLAGLLDHGPGLALALTRATATRLATPMARAHQAAPPRVIAVAPVSAHAAGVTTYVDRVLGELYRPERVLVVRASDGGSAPGFDAAEDGSASWAPRLDEWESRHDVVVLVTEPLAQASPGGWAEFCLRSADRSVMVVGPEDSATGRTAVLDRLPGPPDLCFVDAPDAGHVDDWVRALPPRAHHLVLTDSPAVAVAGLGRLMRRVLRRSVGVVLSGGGARGFAHLGVLAALEEAGIAVDRVGGCSMGAIMGALFAAGHSADVRLALGRHYFVTNRPLGDYTVPRTALLQGARMRALMRDAFEDRAIELLPRPFFCISADLVSAEQVVHRRGPLWPALVASASIPGLLPPLASEGRLLVDGGILNNLPIDVMADDDEGPVVAVDVMRPFAADRGVPRHRPRVRRWAARGGDDGAQPPPLPPIAEVLMRSTVLSSWGTAERNRHRAALTISVPDDGTGLLQWDRLDSLVDLGRQAAQETLAGPGAGVLGL